MAKKIYTINIIRTRDSHTRSTSGTIDELIKYFGYTLECGHSYEYEKGNKKINMNPKTGKSLVTNLNNAEMNRSACGYQSTMYELVQ